MAPTPAKFDYLVIGGGSGGLATARKAASFGKTVAIIESTPRFGGTCVNVGCVPKKLMWHAADLNMHAHHAKHYGLETTVKSVNWPELKEKRDAYIARLDDIYLRNLEKDKVTSLFGRARFVGKNELEVTMLDGNKKHLAADHICVAVGGHALWPSFEGAELGITSDGFFELEDMPKKVVVVGAGYIAIELAGVFNSLGAETHLLIRRDQLLRTFDPMLQERVFKAMKDQGVHIHQQTNTQKVTTEAKNPDTKKPFPLTVHTDKGKIDAECVLWAIGRNPDTSDENLGTSASGVVTDEKGHIKVDKYQNTSTRGIYALGDVTGQMELTPVAIAAGRRLANRLFGDNKDDHLEYTNIPSVVFSHPPCGAIGLTEPQAREQYGDDKVKVYTSTFNSLFYAMFPAEEKTQTSYKLICVGDNEKVVGMHIFGDASDEILQGFGVAVKMGATKKDFDSCVAIHPTAAEELVTMK